MKPVDAMAFQKRKPIRKGNNNKINNFEMEIIDEGVLDTALTFIEKL